MNKRIMLALSLAVVFASTAVLAQITNETAVPPKNAMKASEIVAKIEAVTVESAQQAGLDLLARSRLAIAGLGPGRGTERAADIVERFARAAV